jgi:KUP system potassium uptake protein
VQDGRGAPDGPPEGQAQSAAATAKKRVGSFNMAAHKLPAQLFVRDLDDGDDAADHYNLDTAGHADRAAAVAAASAAGDQSDVIAHAGRAVLALGALGVVFGDIGTSPLYTEQVTFEFRATQHVAVAGVYGVVSLIFWALAIVVSTKYAGFIMRAHNRGDGGIMALAALCQRLKVPRMALMVTLGIFGASLFFGDGMITPAISVLSAVSGLEVTTPSVVHLVVPISLVILIALFMLQRKGTGTVGWLFGPVMLVWFTTLAVIGIPEIVSHPGVLQALSPTWGVRFFADHGFYAFLTLGGVVLAVTGAEALYADRGHFGPAPIRMAWFVVVWPAVLVNYLGQAGWILDHPSAPLHPDTFNPFFSVMPHWAVWPMVILATAATIIASQAVISGSYSVARQAMQLGYLPRLKVVHTSKMEGQIYVPAINWMLMFGVVALVLIFQNSNGLANAYGVAVTGTFILNTVLFLVVAKRLWHTPTWRLAVLGTLFLTVEVTFFLSNAAKILHGAWLPLVAGLLVSVVMMTWRRGQVIVTRNRQAKEGSLDAFLDQIGNMHPPLPRVSGTAVFLVPDNATPLALRSLVEHVHALHETVLILSFVPASVPHVDPDKRFVVQRMGHRLCHVLYVTVRNGYQETNSVPDALALARKRGLLPRNLNLEEASYFLSRITIATTNDPGMARWRKKIFVAMARNAASPIEHFGLPVDRTVAMGSQINV